MSFLRLFSKKCNYRITTLIVKRISTNLANTEIHAQEKSPLQEDSVCQNIEDKIVFNSIIKHGRTLELKREEHLLFDKVYEHYKSEGPQVCSLKYFEISDSLQNIGIDKLFSQEPLESNSAVINEGSEELITISSNESSNTEDQQKEKLTPKSDNNTRVLHKNNWMKDYNDYAEVSVDVDNQKSKEDDNDSITLEIDYGTADPNVPSSTTPCGGCGAHLHCQDSAVPGFLPKEIFLNIKEKQLQSVVCQRCHFLREYNTALEVSVRPEDYPEMISQIKNKKALIILVIDMMDFPCSIFPGILDILGPKRPLVVVGNKIDLLRDVSKDWMQRAKDALITQIPRNANLLHVALISAKTGFGVENLITSLNRLWEYRGDVYLVGCTNVGKSTLFNALLHSDYCKNVATDLIQRATTAPWPGTTLNLLKFPITNPTPNRMAARTARLREEKQESILTDGDRPMPHIDAQINQTFVHGNTTMLTDDYHDDPFAIPKMATLRKIKSPGTGVDTGEYTDSHWLYDTPGVVTRDQITNLLSMEELMDVLPREPLLPRTFQVWPGQSLLLAGLGRLDYLDGPKNIKMTVLAAYCLPVTICFIKHTDEVYRHYLGTEALMVPHGGRDRLQQWPGLQSGQPFVLKGTGWRESCADVVLSSAGWIAVTAEQNSLCQFQAWTPEARGIHVRVPPVLPKAISLKGCRMYKTPAYAVINRHKKKHFLDSK